MRKTQLPTATDLERFPATWRTVSLWRDAQLRLTADDCELVRAMHDQIFPKLSIRVTRGRLHCSPLATSLKPTFEVGALVQQTPVRSLALAMRSARKSATTCSGVACDAFGSTSADQDNGDSARIESARIFRSILGLSR
jgi:hypothetical protein